MATYNGSLYIKEQLNSILIQLQDGDEIIISDDLSTDHTIDIASNINDDRIKILINRENHGPVGNFENALRYAKGDYIFLADQDDIWLPERVSRTIEMLKSDNVDCVICNRIIIDGAGVTNGDAVIQNDFTRYPFYKVLLHNPYIGCCMAFTRKHLELVLPFPSKIPMHDLWIGLLAHKRGKVKFISKPLIAYRRHGNNVTTGKSPYSFLYRIFYRMRVLYQIIQRLNKNR